MPIFTTNAPLIPSKQAYPATTGPFVTSIQQNNSQLATATANAIRTLQQNADQIQKVLRTTQSELTSFQIQDSSGNVIGSLGEYTYNGVNYNGAAFAELYAGFPFIAPDPAEAVISVFPNGEVAIGNSGWVDLVDQFGVSAGWLGTMNDTLPITNAVNSGTGQIRLTVTAHTLANGNQVAVSRVGGVSNASGNWSVAVVNANTVDLVGSVFAGAYTSGGNIDRVLNVTGASSGFGGAILLTFAVDHGYANTNNDLVDVQNVGGVPNATGRWLAGFQGARQIILLGSTFAGSYTSGGTCLRYFPGGWFDNFALGGTSWETARLFARPNGEVDLIGVSLQNEGSDATTTLDQVTGDLFVAGRVGPIVFTELNSSGTHVISNTARTDIASDSVTITDVGGNVYIALTNSGIDTLRRFSIGGTTVISSSRDATFASLTIGALLVVSAAGNVDANGYAIGGIAGVSGTEDVFAGSPSFSIITYSTPGGGSSSTAVCTGLSTKPITFNGGIRTS